MVLLRNAPTEKRSWRSFHRFRDSVFKTKKWRSTNIFNLKDNVDFDGKERYKQLVNEYLNSSPSIRENMEPMFANFAKRTYDKNTASDSRNLETDTFLKFMTKESSTLWNGCFFDCDDSLQNSTGTWKDEVIDNDSPLFKTTDEKIKTSSLHENPFRYSSTNVRAKPTESRFRWSTEIREKIQNLKARQFELQKQREEKNAQFYERIKEKLNITETPAFLQPIVNYDIDTKYLEKESAIDTSNFPVLDEEQEDEIDEALNMSDPQHVLVEEFSIPIKVHDIRTLAPSSWLNDEIINFYFNLIMRRGEENEHLLKVYAFSTFFYPKLAQSGYDAVKRWTRKIDLFSYDLILIPVHLAAHWTLATIHLPEREIRYYDSLGCPNRQCLDILFKYLKSEHLTRKESEMNVFNWKYFVVNGVPQQLNADDCGVFTCQFAEVLSRNCPIYFNQGHMLFLRRKMIYEILHAKLLLTSGPKYMLV